MVVESEFVVVVLLKNSRTAACTYTTYSTRPHALLTLLTDELLTLPLSCSAALLSHTAHEELYFCNSRSCYGAICAVAHFYSASSLT